MDNRFLVISSVSTQIGIIKTIINTLAKNKNYHKYVSKKFITQNTINKIHLNCDVNNGSIINGVQQPILCSFYLDKPTEYKVFCEPETINWKK